MKALATFNCNGDLIAVAAAITKVEVLEDGRDVRDEITDWFDDYADDRPKFKPGQPSTATSVEWVRKNASSPATQYSPAQRHYQKLTVLNPTARDMSELQEYLDAVLEELGYDEIVKIPKTGHFTLQIDSPDDGVNILGFNHGMSGLSIIHNYKA